jgi:hypothetical protein
MRKTIHHAGIYALSKMQWNRNLSFSASVAINCQVNKIQKHFTVNSQLVWRKVSGKHKQSIFLAPNNSVRWPAIKQVPTHCTPTVFQIFFLHPLPWLESHCRATVRYPVRHHLLISRELPIYHFENNRSASEKKYGEGKERLSKTVYIDLWCVH